MTTKYAFMEQELAALKDEGRLINIRTMQSPADAWMVVDGKRVLNFCTNNYLGLANHPEIKAAAQARDRRVGRGARRGAHHRRHAGPAHRVRAAHGRLQVGRGRAAGAERILRQPGRDPAAGRAQPSHRRAGRHLFRPAQPRQHHRRRAAVRRQNHRL